MGKNQFPKTDPFLPESKDWQQAVCLVMQSRASSPSLMFSRITILLFWYVVPLSENQTSPAPWKKEIHLQDLHKNQFFGRGLSSGYVFGVILIRKATTEPLAISDKKKNNTKKHFTAKHYDSSGGLYSIELNCLAG